MAALKFERYIVKMSLEQKLRLITSTEFYKSSPVGGYEFPVFDVTRNPYTEECREMRVTQFPNDVALASAWNPALTEEVYAAIGEETRAVNSFGYYDCTNDLSEENITSDNTILAEFLSRKVAGLRRGNQFVNFRGADYGDSKKQSELRAVRDKIFSVAQPNSVIISDPEDGENLRRRFKYDGMTFGVVSSVEEALGFLYGGACFLFLKEDVFDPLLNKLTTLTEAYAPAHLQFVNGKIPESSFARMLRNFKIFDGGVIDKACDDIISVLFAMKQANEDASLNFKSLSGDGARFDEINHDALALAAARQSAVLIKNQNGILPLRRGVKVAVMGESAKFSKYARSYINSTPTNEVTAFEAINDYAIDTVGYALGYANGEVGRSDLFDHAAALSGKADCVLLYLAAEKGAQNLPPEQLALVDMLAGRGVKIIAIVSSEGQIDVGFADKCEAVLLTYVSGQGGVRAALEIVSGAITPSGKLVAPAGKYDGGEFTQIYPLGHGLTYARFAYENLKVNESGASFTVKNVGNCDGYAVPQLFVRKKNTLSEFKEKTMKGFKKAFVKAGDSVRVQIPFDQFTFSQYSDEKGYFVEGGLYTIYIGEKIEDDDFSGILLLKKSQEKKDFESRVVDSYDDGSAVEFSESNLPSDVKNARKKLPFALKITLALILAIYIDAVLALFIFGDVIGSKDTLFYAICGAVAAIANALIIAYICVSSKRRKAEKYLHANVVLTDMIDNVEEFTEIAKVKYAQPVEGDFDQSPDQFAQQEQAEEQEVAATYEIKFDEGEQIETAPYENVSFGELCRNLRDFALTRGVNLEITSARVLVAAIASCKIVFLTSKNAEMLPRFVNILSEYYGNESVVTADGEWRSVGDLLWCAGEEDGKFVPSRFSKAVHAASSSKEREAAVVIDNVSFKNLGSYFYSFLDYANHHTESYVINFNEETQIELPDNLTYILVPQGGIPDYIPTEILNGSIVAEVMLSPVENTPEEQVEPKSVSHEDYLNLIAAAKENSFVSERVWKKLDDLVEAICANERFAIGNKNTIQLETFTSVLIEGGSDEPEAVTNMFLAKLAYLLKNTRAYRQDGGEKTVFAIIERLFVDEELTKIRRALTKHVAEEAEISEQQAERSAQPAQDTDGAQAQQSAEPEAQTAETQGEQPENQPETPAETPENAKIPQPFGEYGQKNDPETAENGDLDENQPETSADAPENAKIPQPFAETEQNSDQNTADNGDGEGDGV